MVLADPGTLRTHPWMEAALERRGVAVHPLPDPVRDMQGAGVDASKDAVAAARSLGHVRRLGALKAPTLSQGDLMVVLGLRAVPVGNIDSLFEYPTAEMPFWAVPDARPTFQLNADVMAVYVHEGLYAGLLSTLAKVLPSKVLKTAQSIINYHVNLEMPYPRTMLPGLYGAFAGNTFDGHKYDDGFGYRMRNSVVGTRTRYWHDYLQVIIYTEGFGVEAMCHFASEKRHHQRGYPATYILQRHCCAVASVLREVERNGGDAPNDKVSKRTFAAESYCTYFDKVMSPSEIDSKSP